MKLPSVPPMVENLVCKNKEEFLEIITRALSQSEGVFTKIFGKVEGTPYYATLILDREKILAIEVLEVGSSTSIVGEPAIQIMRDMLESGSFIIDVFPLTDIELKVSIMDNMEVYSLTPKVRLEEICSDLASRVVKETRPEIPVRIQENTQIEKPNPTPRKPKTEIKITSPVEFDPYLRGMARKIKNALNGLGITPEKIEIDAKEVRYALGAGKGLHATVRIVAEGLDVKTKREIENFIYREAGGLSKEIEERVVISKIEFS